MTPEFRRSLLFWFGLPFRLILAGIIMWFGPWLFVDDWDEIRRFSKSIVKGRPSL